MIDSIDMLDGVTGREIEDERRIAHRVWLLEYRAAEIVAGKTSAESAPKAARAD